MIACPQCQAEITTEENERYFCRICGHKIFTEEGIIFFHPEDKNSSNGMEGCILDDAAQSEEKHFWMSARRKYLKNIFYRFVKPKNTILEIGAGTGYVAKYLINRGYRNYAIGDINQIGLKVSGKFGYQHKYQFNLLKTVFTEHFDIIGIFDVLEHISDDDAAVRNIHKMLKKGGKAIITVPAHQWLWSKQDAIAYHRRRYEIKGLKELFRKNGFNILKASGFFFSLIPIMYLRTIINRDDRTLSEKDFKNRFKVNIVLNMLLKMMLNIEITLFGNCCSRYGGSIVLVAEKP